MAETTNVYDVWWWISKVIASCEDVDHINACERLIQNFSIMYNDTLLTRKLYVEYDDKIQELIDKLDE